jgi:hypothetical protein
MQSAESKKARLALLVKQEQLRQLLLSRRASCSYTNLLTTTLRIGTEENDFVDYTLWLGAKPAGRATACMGCLNEGLEACGKDALDVKEKD